MRADVWRTAEHTRFYAQLQWPGRVHPTATSSKASFLSGKGAFADPVCVHLAGILALGQAIAELIRLLECGAQQGSLIRLRRCA